jgi:CBS domain containing-hemolysin-like protein
VNGSFAWIALLLSAGIFFSAFFSGCETGFYRATRVRLVLDALGGSRTAKGLLWMINRPSIFVATTLIGNNLANYATSAAIVIGAERLFHGSSLANVLAPLVLAPLVFVYGELLPKNLFFHAPNRLLLAGGPLFIVCAVLFLPLSLVVWALNKGLQTILGESPQRVRLTLARQELQQVLSDGHQAGLLRPAQQNLAQSLFSMAEQKAIDSAVPAGRVARISHGMSKADVLRQARRQRISAYPVEGPDRSLIGYLRVVDLYLQEAPDIDDLRPLIEIPDDENHLSALMRLQAAGESMGRIVDAHSGETIAVVTTRQLSDSLFRGGRV